MDYYRLLTGLVEQVSGSREDRPTAGTKYRLMGLVADIAEVVHALQEQVLQRVSQEAVLDVDVDIDYAELSEQVLLLEYEEREDQDEAVREQERQVNEGLAALSDVLCQIDNQLERRHKDEEYERLYMSELKRYNSSSTVRSAKKNYEKWKDNECYGNPTADDLEGYRLCKLLKMFEKGVFNDKVAMNQRSKRYPDEVDFSQVDDDHPLKKTAYKHYAALRKIVDFRDGYLVVNPVHVGQYFFVTRKDENAKVNRTNFLKYMHKIGLAQEERQRLQVAQEDAELANLLPDVLATGLAMKYWKRLQEAGFVDMNYQLTANTTRKQAMYIADVFSDKLQMRSKWKPFQDLWHINNLAQEKWDMQETGKAPTRSEEIDMIFKD